jgi:Domain of unknown function (DUF4349)
MSERDPITATIERDLAAIDEALDAGATTHPDPEARALQELALALRADSPEPAHEFERDLRARLDAGFPPPAGSARARLAARGAHFSGGARRLVPALATITALLVPIVLVVTLAGSPQSGGGDDDGGGSVAGGDGGGGAVQEVAPGAAQSQAADSGPAALPAPRPATGQGFAPGRRARKIERTISLELESPADELAQVADRVTAVTGRFGGFVLSSSLSTGEDGSGGDFELRIPTERLQPALRELSSLATVRSQQQSGRDVTREQVTATDRLQSARAERASLLRRLEQAATDEEAEALRRRLDLVAGEISGLRGRLRDLRLRTDYAVVNVSLLPAGESSDDGGGGAGASFDDALGDAGDLLVGTAGVLIRILALALPLALLGLIAWLGARIFRRRRRESALA